MPARHRLRAHGPVSGLSLVLTLGAVAWVPACSRSGFSAGQCPVCGVTDAGGDGQAPDARPQGDVGADGAVPDVAIPAPVALLGNWETGAVHTLHQGDRRMLVVFFLAEDDQPGGPGVTPVAMSYGTMPMTRVPTVGRSVHDTGNTQNIVEVWYLLAADLDMVVNDSIAVTLSRTPTETPMYAHVLLQGVDQSQPFGDGAIYACSCNPISTAPLSTRAGDLVLTAADNREQGSHTPLNGFTLGVGQSFSSHTGTTAYKPATGADETPSLSHDTSPFWHAMLGVVVQASSSE